MLCVASLFAGTALFISIVVGLTMKNGGFAEIVDAGGTRIGIIEISGIISEADEILNNIRQFREDDSIKAIVLRINSPGGGAAPSQEIYSEVLKTVKVKKVVASMGSIAASGGYYVAACADRIMASPGTITGSIGVIIGYTNFKELLDKIGLAPVVIKSGKYKDIGSPVREMSDEEKKIIQDFTVQVHDQFISAIAEGRKLKRSAVETMADGRIMTGETAKNLGLIDELGNFEDAVALAGKLAGIEGKITKVYPKEKHLSFFKFLTGESPREIINRAINSDIFAGYLYSPNSN
jgi:protease-4